MPGEYGTKSFARALACTWRAKLTLVVFQTICLLLLIAAPASAGHATALNPATPTNAQYHLRLFHTHTNERLDIVYREGDHYLPEAIDELEHFLRDHRTGTVHHFDPRLFDLLNDLTARVGRPQEEIDVVCGYRTPWSNNFLRSRSSAVAKHSLHMQAMAIDIRMPGVQTAVLRDAALSLHRGGVGYYARQQFVHVDVGRFRRW